MPLPKSDYLSDVWKDNIFADKVVFCTGGNGSICSAQVRALVHLGANACIVGRNEEKTSSVAKDIATARSGAKVIGMGGIDVRSVDSLQQAVDRCVNELGGIDFLIAGAAGNFLAPLSQLSANAMKTVVDIDLLGSYNATKVTLPHLLTSVAKHNSPGALPAQSPTTVSSNSSQPSNGPAGRILYISATLHYIGTPLQTHAAVAKAGVDALSAQVAIEYGPRGITSNVIAPGPIGGTEGMDRLSKKEADADKLAPKLKRIPLGRWGSVKEIADATVFLFSDTGNYVTGQVTIVDGGAWRTAGGSPGGDFPYPDFLLGGEEVSGVGGSKRKGAGSKL